MDEKYLRRCIVLANKALGSGELPFGCVITKGNKIIAESVNNTNKGSDVTLHAEIIAMRAAQKVLKTKDLSKCTIYSSTEPCPMCSFMLRELRFKKVVFGTISPVMGGYSKFKIIQDRGLFKTMPTIFAVPPKVVAGLIKKEADSIWEKQKVVQRQALKLKF